MELDAFDHRILTALQRDADISNTLLADAIGLSASACLRRVARLKKLGVIRRVVAVIDPAKVNRALTAVVTVEFARHGSGYRQQFVGKVRSEAAITQCYVVTGEVSCVVILHVHDMEEYLSLADRLFDQDENVQAFHTYIVMQTVKQETSIPLEAPNRAGG